MNTMEWRTIDKTTWERGKWDAEPDKKQWPDAATGLPCLAVRNPGGGNWCGYVGVPNGHPLHGVGYSKCSAPGGCGETYCDHTPDASLRVHGGITFSDRCADVKGDHSRFICHIPEPGEPDDVWWFGFDCAHAWDVLPGYDARTRSIFDADPARQYRTLAYVERECASLARQLADQA